ncbi:type IV secretion protein IcmC [Legionella cardiaca]|uniref:Type IV secretion protein IcmC n=1 Tax=Legionella cardiaca TaxID=1071983 RepID=A0ABY8AVH4_9GAMM|nr:type IV secretion protein IcmC [Legionella cardiaca]WED43416.1 type IV secretion protein IcmC [Legionella cardiaca]
MSTDLITMIGNVSRSLFPVQHLLTGLAYLLGITFFIIALTKLKKIGGAGKQSSNEKIFVPMAYLAGAAMLLYLPSALTILANSAFGVGNVLQYIPYSPYNIYSSMGLVIQTAGLIWFIRGCVLLIHASEPGVQWGPKGLVFLCAGVLAMNFQNTTNMLNAILTHLTQLTLAVKNYQGF